MPWRRLVREWCIYAALMVVVFLVITRESSVGIVLGLVASLPLYLALGYVLAKFGYTRKSLRELRDASRSDARDSVPVESAPSVRARPAPTRRTNAGAGRGTKRR